MAGSAGSSGLTPSWAPQPRTPDTLVSPPCCFPDSSWPPAAAARRPQPGRLTLVYTGPGAWGGPSQGRTARSPVFTPRPAWGSAAWGREWPWIYSYLLITQAQL